LWIKSKWQSYSIKPFKSETFFQIKEKLHNYIYNYIRGHSNNMWHLGEGGAQPKCHLSFLSIFDLKFTAKDLKKLCFFVKLKLSRHTGEGLQNYVTKCHIGNGRDLKSDICWGRHNIYKQIRPKLDLISYTRYIVTYS